MGFGGQAVPTQQVTSFVKHTPLLFGPGSRGYTYAACKQGSKNCAGVSGGGLLSLLSGFSHIPPIEIP